MYTPWIMLAALTIIIYALGYSCYQRQTKQHKKRQVKGLESTCSLLTIMKAIQQHRGISSGILGGKPQQKSKLQELSNTIKQHFTTLEPTIKSAYPQQWETITPQWRNIQSNWLNTDVLINFENHCDVLENIQSLILDVTDNTGLTSSANNAEQALAGEIFAHFPALIEDLGQLRALSTHAAASRDCITAFRLHLQFLMEQLSQHKKYLSQKNNDEHQNLISEVNELINLVKAEILNTETISIDPDRLFQRITQVMDKCFGSIDRGINQLKATPIN